MTEQQTPGTAAGRTLYEVAEHMEWTNGAPVSNRYMLDAILDIEAEAAQAAVTELKKGFENVHDWGHYHFAPAGLDVEPRHTEGQGEVCDTFCPHWQWRERIARLQRSSGEE